MSLPYYFPQNVYNQDGGGASQPWLQPDNSKTAHYPAQWDNNSGFHVTSGNNYGPGQIQGGGGQNRVGPQQPQQPQQPTPTSTPPGVIHGDMSKQQPLMPNQSGQMNFVQSRPLNPNFPSFQRGGSIQQQTIRTHGRAPIVANYTGMHIPAGGVLTQATPQTIVQAVSPYPAALMYQQRQGTPYAAQGQYMPQQLHFNYPSQFYQPVISQAAYQGMSSGGPSPQATQQPPVTMMRPPIVQATPVVPPAKQEPKKRTHAIKIIDPLTNEEVPIDESGGNNNNITPTRSNDSSARETPQPNAGVPVDTTVAADFAARVAARAMASEPPPPAQSPSSAVQDNIPVAISESDVHHKQQPLVVPSSEKISSIVLSTASEEFVPRSHKQPQPCEVLEEPLVPTVSAETDSPAIEIQRSKEYPALKNPPLGPGSQSPLRVANKKQKSESERSPPAMQMSPPLVDNKDVNSTKKGPKSAQKEEIVPAPKERREHKRSTSKEQSPAPSPDITSQPEVTLVPVVKAAPSVSVTKEPVKSNSVSPLEEPSSKAPPHHNGETALTEPPPVSVDGNKTARQKNKKSGKMRGDLNRKGVEKEGSEMDAFTTEPSIVSEERDRPATPPSSPVNIKVPPSPPPVFQPQPEAPVSPVDKIKEDLEEKEDKLVAAKNEENNKVSALNKPAEEEPAPVIEKTVPPLTLRRSYKKDQWSPLNPEGKKKYERDFLMDLKAEPLSSRKPENLPDVVAVLRDSNNGRNQMPVMNRDGRGMMPDFYPRSSQSQRGPLPKRGSQQGNKGKNNPKVIHMSLSLHEDVKLKTAENAWKPARLVTEQNKPEEDKQTEELYKNVRGVLNKLTPQKFDTLMKKFQLLPINSEDRLKGVINLIFEKAVDEPSFSKAYANMCKLCSKLEVSKVENGQEQKVNFRKILITRCQTEFERNNPDELNSAKWLEEIQNCTDPEKKKELQLTYAEKERVIRMKSVGNIRFIGELFKLTMLTPAIMYRCIEHLLNTPEEESLECLCKLLTTIGKDLEFGSAGAKGPQVSLNPYFQKMSDLAQKREGSKVSSRVRFMLQDVIELRHNKWVPRREDNNPKTIEQINKEAERESMEMTMALNQQPPRMNRQNDRPDDRRKGNRGINPGSQDGWETVQGSSRHYHNKFSPAFEAAKMQNMVKPEVDLNSLSLGGSSMFRFNTAAKTAETKPNASFTSSNLYSALSRGEDRKPPPTQPMNRRGVTPTPSIERDKERQRMIQGALDSNEGRNSRGSSLQRERPQPPSRDSSVPRQAPDTNEAGTKAKEEDKSTRVVDEKAAQLAEEKLDRQTNTIFVEYLDSFSSVDDVRQDIEQLYPSDKMGSFVQKALDIALEKKAGAQQKIGLLISALMDYNLFSPEVVVDQLSLLYENAEDISIDVPKVWELQAHIMVPVFAAEKINFNHFKDACGPVLKTKTAIKLLVPVLTNLVNEKGAGFVRKVWDSSNVSLTDFLPGDVDIDAFIKEKSLEYLTGDPLQYDNSSDDLSWDELQAKMLRLMQSNQPFEKIQTFISTNVGDKVEDLQFIRALITALCEACTTGPNYNLDLPRFQEFKKLIQRYVDNKEDRELACLSSVHNLSCQLQHPQGLIKNIFSQFWENSLISCESFLKWRDDDHEKLENKGVSVLSLTSFFDALNEVDTDDENS